MTDQEPTGTDGDLPATRDQVAELIEVVRHLAETNTWRKVGWAVLWAVVGLFVVISVTNVMLYRQVKTSASCRASFAAARADALDDWIRALPANTPKTPADLAKAEEISQIKRLAHLKVSDQYTNAVQNHC